MSRPKKYRVFPKKSYPLTDAKLARMVSAALRQDYGDMPSAVKYVGMQTGINLRAIKNWFQACHAPSSSHFLTLASISPSILRIILECIGGADFMEALTVVNERYFSQKRTARNVPLNVPEKLIFANHNKRQAWFLSRLQKETKVTARHIQLHAGVTLKTARRDIAELKKRGIIRFIGAKKTGHYRLTNTD